MKNWLYASVCGAALLTGTAHAQIPVTDGLGLSQRATQQLQTLGEWAKQARAMEQEFAVLKQQYQQLQQTYAAIAHLPDAALQELGQMMNVPQFRQALPDVNGMINSLSGGGVGGLGNMSGLAQQYLGRNQLYNIPGMDAGAQQVRGIANSVAGVQGLLDTLYQSAGGRISALQTLEGQLAAAPDAKATADIQARLGMERAVLQAQQLQATTLQTWQQSQIRTDENQRDEVRRCQIDAVLADSRAKRPIGSTGEDCGQRATQQQALAMMTGVTPDGTPIVAASVGAGGAGGGAALEKMMAQSWGNEAAVNATRLGVSPAALAATAQVESNFTNPAARDGGTIAGSFQMKASTFQAAARQAGISSDLSGQMNPAIQSAAAAQELKNGALQLQRGGMNNPDLLSTRMLYQWGSGAGPALARADDSATMSSALPGYSAAVLASNGIRPGQTVGEYRADLARKLGPAARQPVLLGVRSA